MALRVVSLVVCFELLCISSGRAMSWPTNVPGGLPIINVRLAPPRSPHAQVQAEVARLTKLREELEAQEIEHLDHAVNATLVVAEESIRKTIQQTMGLFQHPVALGSRQHFTNAGRRPVSLLQAEEQNDAFTMKIDVLRSQEAPPSGNMLRKIRALEGKRQKYEKNVFAQTVHELRSLTDIVNRELKARLLEAIETFTVTAKKGAATALLPVSVPSFLATGLNDLPAQTQANVRVGSASEKWPMVGDLIADMENQRDKSESVLQSKIIEAELRLLQTENEIIETYVRKAVSDLAGA